MIDKITNLLELVWQKLPKWLLWLLAPIVGFQLIMVLLSIVKALLQYIRNGFTMSTVKKRSELLQALVLDEYSPDGSRKRTPSGIAEIPEISNLAGLLMQNALPDVLHKTAGTTCTLKWAAFDKKTRTVELQNYGNFDGRQIGEWSYFNNNQWRNLLIPLARVFNYSYRFTFDEDWQRADIDLGLFYTLSGKARIFVPRSLLHFDMVQTKESKNGSQWLRRSSTLGGVMKSSYILEAVYASDGSPTELVENFKKVVPETQCLSK